MDRHTTGQVLRLTGLYCLLMLAGTGCKSFSLWGGSDDEDERVEEMTRTDGIKGPLERVFERSVKSDDKNSEAIPGYYDRGQNELAKAERMVQSGQYVEAEKELKAINKEFKRYAVREDAMFYLGEAQYHQQDYAHAQDTFDELVKDFPSTKYQTQISKRQFAIAGVWLGFPDVITPGDIKLAASIEDANEAEVKPHDRDSWDPTLAVPFLPNFHDSSRPYFDTEGRALQSLKSIWLNDPGSDLADDALMMTASYHLRKGNNVEADEYFAALRQQYPKSPHFQNAYVLGSHVKLMAYEGSAYDGTRLEEAAQLKESALRLWPENKMSGQLERELDKIEKAKARREWGKVEFYLKKGRKDSAAIYCREILRLYPESSYASNAREFLKENPSASRAKANPEPVEPDADSGWDWNVFPKLEKIPDLRPKLPTLKKPELPEFPDLRPGFMKKESPSDEPQEYDSAGRVTL